MKAKILTPLSVDRGPIELVLKQITKENVAQVCLSIQKEEIPVGPRMLTRINAQLYHDLGNINDR